MEEEAPESERGKAENRKRFPVPGAQAGEAAEPLLPGLAEDLPPRSSLPVRLHPAATKNFL